MIIIVITYLFSTFSVKIRKPLKIGCADGGSYLKYFLTVYLQVIRLILERYVVAQLFLFYRIASSLSIVEKMDNISSTSRTVTGLRKPHTHAILVADIFAEEIKNAQDNEKYE